MDAPYEPLDVAPEIPDPLAPAPPGATWWAQDAPDGQRLLVAFVGDGRHPPRGVAPGAGGPSPMVAYVYVVPTADADDGGDPFMRLATLEELHAALALCPLETPVWQLPPFVAAELPTRGAGTVIAAVQIGAVTATEAHLRWQLSAPGSLAEAM